MPNFMSVSTKLQNLNSYRRQEFSKSVNVNAWLVYACRARENKSLIIDVPKLNFTTIGLLRIQEFGNIWDYNN